ncbi:hypothetical protein AGMMS49928_25700 [Spirochaetia bacterium]|nr:hypothetical protein AGMMS49928_25700 [Spirochaetia bacterium]
MGLSDKATRASFNEVKGLSGKNITAISTGDLHTVALGSDRKVYATGKNSDGRLGLGDTTNRTSFTEVTGLGGKNITAISVGSRHAVVLSSDGKVYATGNNSDGQLGLGDTTPRGSFTEVTLP